MATYEYTATYTLLVFSREELREQTRSVHAFCALKNLQFSETPTSCDSRKTIALTNAAPVT